VAERDAELAVLSAMAHGNGPKGLAVLQAALVALGRLDLEHAAVYFQIVYNVLREPVRQALEKFMEGQTEDKATFPPLMQRLIDRGRVEGLRDALFQLLAHAGITLTEEERARIQACTEPETLDRWLKNVLGAKSAADVLS
jgi:hypothetical protein